MINSTEQVLTCYSWCYVFRSRSRRISGPSHFSRCGFGSRGSQKHPLEILSNEWAKNAISGECFRIWSSEIIKNGNGMGCRRCCILLIAPSRLETRIWVCFDSNVSKLARTSGADVYGRQIAVAIHVLGHVCNRTIPVFMFTAA